MPLHIGIIEGDGIGPEVTAWGRRVLEGMGNRHGIKLDLVPVGVGGQTYLESGAVLPDAALKTLRGCHAIVKGPLGLPELEPGLVERKGILALRQVLGQYINLRPVHLFAGLEDASPLKDDLLKRGVDFVIVRENSEGLYSRMGGIAEHTATDVSLFTERAVRRIMEYAFQLAQQRRRRLCSVDKANILSSSLFWRRKFEAMADAHPEVKCSSQLVDSFCLLLLQDPSPRKWDVVVVDNMFGDIIADEAAAIVGSLGVCPAANLNPGGISMVEPVHGSAPEKAGQGVANPLAMILSIGLLFRHCLEREDLGLEIEKAVQRTLDKGLRTPDIAAGATPCSTDELGAEVLRQLGC